MNGKDANRNTPFHVFAAGHPDLFFHIIKQVRDKRFPVNKQNDSVYQQACRLVGCSTLIKVLGSRRENAAALNTCWESFAA